MLKLNTTFKLLLTATLALTACTAPQPPLNAPAAETHDHARGPGEVTGAPSSTPNTSQDHPRPRLSAQAITPPSGGPAASEFRTETLISNYLVHPIAMQIDNKGIAYVVGRKGHVYSYNIDTGEARVLGMLNVFSSLEDGLLGIALDPQFDTNRALYLSYSPPTANSSNPNSGLSRVSRFVLKADGTLDLTSEKMIIEWPTQRALCCHVGGQIKFTPNGDLYISAGDNTNPFSTAFAPLEEAAGREYYDAQRTSANTNSLSGKILRIRPNATGGYTVPAGNLFPGSATERPEIYTMGNRNPYRITVDVNPTTNESTLYWGEFGPDADNPDPARGPLGQDEVNRTTTPGNFGWPYAIGPNQAYIDQSNGQAYNPASPINDSPNNTGDRALPAARGSWFSQRHTGQMVGFVYHSKGSSDPLRLPAFFENKLIGWDFNNRQLHVFNPAESAPTLVGYEVLKANTIDMVTDPRTQRIYAIAYPRGVVDSQNEYGELYALNFGTNDPPVVNVAADKTTGALPLTVNFSSAGTSDPQNDALTYAWDFDGNGTTDSTASSGSWTYNTAGQYQARLTVRDSKGAVGANSVRINAGVNAPTVNFTSPTANGTVLTYGTPISWNVSVTDVEDGSIATGSIPCSSVRVEIETAHVTRPGEHVHGMATLQGCNGTYTINEADINPTEDIYFKLTAFYTDKSGLESTATTWFNPNKHEAELWYTSDDGGGSAIQSEATSDTGGGQNISYLNNNSWIMLRNHNLADVESILFRVATDSVTSGTIEARLDSPTGPLIGTAGVAGRGSYSPLGWQEWGVHDHAAQRRRPHRRHAEPVLRVPRERRALQRELA